MLPFIEISTTFLRLNEDLRQTKSTKEMTPAGYLKQGIGFCGSIQGPKSGKNAEKRGESGRKERSDWERR